MEEYISAQNPAVQQGVNIGEASHHSIICIS